MRYFSSAGKENLYPCGEAYFSYGTSSRSRSNFWRGGPEVDEQAPKAHLPAPLEVAVLPRELQEPVLEGLGPDERLQERLGRERF